MATLSDLRDSARAKADEESTGFISDSRLDSFLNQGLRFIYGKIAQRFEDYFVVPGTVGNSGLITVSADDNEYSLPTTAMKIVRVEHRSSTSTSENDWRKLDRINIGSDRVDDFFPLREGYVAGFGYFIAGNNIYLRPVPKQAFSLRLWFVPRVTALSADADVPGIPEEYHELIAEYAAIQVLRKSGEGIYKESMDVFNLELLNMLETIESRDQQAEQMVITDESDYGF